ncbi:MAG: alpha/beta fold hydrolase, partial [Planctomycetes bacterium]|nr:alpha/beta fold hydrolase [Planctomycetota bacterium]
MDVALAAVVLLASTADALAQPAERPSTPPVQGDDTMRTLGGRQYWGDVHFFHGWRIQQNVFTKHYRLLDEKDFRHARGTFDECLAKLDEFKRQLELPPMKGKAVVFVHGIVRSSKSFHKMTKRLRGEGYHTFGFDYPSTRITISEAADYFDRAIGSLEGIEEIHLVVHSMGGLVVRYWLKEHNDERIRRMVMIGVPNTGAAMADRLRRNLIYKFVMGPAGAQLATDGEGLAAALPVPPFEFAILAGARGTVNGYNPLIPGDDDGTVTVVSTRLSGAADFVTVRCLHSFIMAHDDAIDYTIRFLDTGRFRADGEPHAIPKPMTNDQ